MENICMYITMNIDAKYGVPRAEEFHDCSLWPMARLPTKTWWIHTFVCPIPMFRWRNPILFTAETISQVVYVVYI